MAGIYTHVFKIGQLEVYSIREVTFTNTSSIKESSFGYYWRDPGSPQGVGPFPTIQECVSNYEKFIFAVQPDPETKKTSVIQVNFLTKKRVIPKFPL